MSDLEQAARDAGKELNGHLAECDWCRTQENRILRRFQDVDERLMCAKGRKMWKRFIMAAMKAMSGEAGTS